MNELLKKGDHSVVDIQHKKFIRYASSSAKILASLHIQVVCKNACAYC